eukprot:scaffold69342_cov51-Phaeocystis_antarctica.AAC.3
MGLTACGRGPLLVFDVYAPSGIGGTAPSSLRIAPAGMAGASSSLSAAALCVAACPSGDCATHSAAS